MVEANGGFLWGTASAAYQIEGGWDADGKGLSKWDIYTNRYRGPEAVTGRPGETGNVAINAYDRDQYLKDIALMRDAGFNVYRFSLSWPRILPEGVGRVNQAGLDYYSRLVDDLMANGIAPMVTLYHWDFPWALQEKGGFHNRAAIGWFREYAGVVFQVLADRVTKFITMNEPIVDLLYMDLIADNVINQRPPETFSAEQFGRQIPALHNLFVASAAAIGHYHALGRGGTIGIAIPLHPTIPVDPDSSDDVAAARIFDAFYDRWSLDAALRGTYADDVLATLRRLKPDFTVSDEDLALLKANPADFLGVNFYSPAIVRRNDAFPLGVEGGINPDEIKAHNGPVRPDQLHRLLIYIRDQYDNVPVFITENGAGFGDRDEVVADGLVKDPLRADYITRHAEAVLQARREGADVRGYMVWCPFDNFEWFRGYQTRFGIVWVDFDTQRRIPKESYHAYKALIARERGA